MTIQPNAVEQIRRLSNEFDIHSSDLYVCGEQLDGKELGDQPVEDHLQTAIARATEALELLKLSVSHLRSAVNIAHGWEITSNPTA